MRARPLLPLIALGLGACAKEREQAPRALDDIVHALFADFEDADAMVQDADDLSAWLDTEGDSDTLWDGLRLTNLSSREVSDVDHASAQVELSQHIGLANGAPSAFSPLDHAARVPDADQTWTDPDGFTAYERANTDGDAAAFAAGGGVLRTRNTVTKKGGFGIAIPFELHKDYRWVEADRDVLVARSWVAEPGCSDNGKNCVMQSFGVDAYVRDGDASLRLYAVWLELVTEVDAFLSEDGRVAMLAESNQTILDTAEQALGGR